MVELIEKYIDPALSWCKEAFKKAIQFFISAFKFLKYANTEYPRIIKGILSVLIVTVLTFSITSYTGITRACEIHLNGMSIGCVSTEEEVYKAKEIAKELVYDQNGKVLIDNIAFQRVYTGSRNLITAENLADQILENTDDIKKSVVLTVDDKVIGYANTKEEVDTLLNEYLATKQKGSDVISAELHNTVKISESYVSAETFEEAPDLETEIFKENVIPLKTIKYETTKKEVNYTTTYQKTDTMYENSERTTVFGEKGLNEVVEKVGYIDGVEVSRETVSVTVLKEPSNAVVLVGTKPYTQGSNSTNSASAKGFIWPVDLGVYNVITSYWGDGRGHKGYDIACAKGTKIYAVKAGTVIESQWSNSYGYFITIDHGNGVTTRYAHCSKLFSRVGQTVSQGENIALVGSTGWSTGPHVHFEVRINDVPQNPKYYISR